MTSIESREGEVYPIISTAEIAGMLFRRGSLELIVRGKQMRLLSRLGEPGRSSCTIETQRLDTKGEGFIHEGGFTAATPSDALRALFEDKPFLEGPIRESVNQARKHQDQ